MANKPARVVVDQDGNVIFAELNGIWVAVNPVNSTREDVVVDPNRGGGDVAVNMAIRRQKCKIEQVS